MESSAGNDIIAKLSAEDRAALQGSSEQEKDIYVFFSFDLVGSTKFKVDHPFKWPYVTSQFYDLIHNELKKRIPQVCVWKYLGDEILLYASIHLFESDSELYRIPENVFSVQAEVSRSVQTLSDGKRLELDVKSTVWIAGALTMKPQDLHHDTETLNDSTYRNIRIQLPIGKQIHDDFLGPDMDAGFRVAKHAYQNKVVLSANLAYLLTRMKKPRRLKSIDSRMQIVALDRLKGVWDGKYYPIIWYCDNWKSANNDFSYAAHKENQLVENVLSGRTEPIDNLEKIFAELGKSESADDFVEECERINTRKNREMFTTYQS